MKPSDLTDEKKSRTRPCMYKIKKVNEVIYKQRGGTCVILEV